MAHDPPWQLESYRPWLRLLVRQMQLGPRLLRRSDWSDLVQDTLVKAVQKLDQFEGTTEGELVKWLKVILTRVVIDRAREERAQKCDVALEQSLHAAVAESSARLEAYVAADQSSPSEQVQRQELRAHVAAAVDRLPEDQRDVVILRDLQGCPVAEIAARLQLTEKSVAGRLRRGRARLRGNRSRAEGDKRTGASSVHRAEEVFTLESW